MLTSGAERFLTMASRILVVDDSPTIRRVVSAILERNGYEPTLAADGQDAMNALSSGEVKADLILLDFVMPRMNGYQFCRALRDNAELAMTPVVLMSAKGDRIRDQFVQQTGAIDAITKPFDAQALVAVVENALRRLSTQTRVSSQKLPELDEPDESTTAEVVEFETRRTRVAQIVAQKLAATLTKTMDDSARAPGTDLTKALAVRLEQEGIVEMIEAVRNLETTEMAPALEGDLAALPIGAILQLLQTESQSGTLVCKGPDATISATFRAGLVDVVQSSGASDEFRLGRYFVEQGMATPADIDDILRGPTDEPLPQSSVHIRQDAGSSPAVSVVPATVREDPHARLTMPQSGPAPEPFSVKPRLLGAALLETKKITEAELKAALSQQSSELLYDVLRWSKGRFEFRREPASAVAENARLGLPVAALVMEGFRRVDEWRVLEKTLGSFDAVLVREDLALGKLDAAELPERERRMLDLVDGERTVRQLIAGSHMSSFDACRVLVQFLEARVLRRRA
jgi:DNA-binding response OmpR family regulator